MNKELSKVIINKSRRRNKKIRLKKLYSLQKKWKTNVTRWQEKVKNDTSNALLKIRTLQGPRHPGIQSDHKQRYNIRWKYKDQSLRKLKHQKQN